ncbi:phospholipid/cholesterol/gamma-HCH transport system substrate-binding protein [Mycolicibacterium rutilum]|uniref:Phospholipid/cholesterol/gamma-HCH transport system substrate-binding protein n=1 Tax=Mycolicibacterium rutilum TaxID=370526 RepID=A0A1H6JQ76_MYCRU|nr:MCE family protein [Mycolicibacterium rutilum]SEH63052.1 phospholipid/cholesterol/gamma-HCH transport system substrate-binding protein [Mycolicibacterium rutilum]
MFVDRHKPPYKAAGAVFVIIAVVAAVLIYLQFRGELATKTQVTLLSARAGLVVEPGAKVTFNGVEIGRVGRIAVAGGDDDRARLTLDVDPRYLDRIPANVTAEIRATTVFGNKYISFTSPADASPQRIAPGDVIQAVAVTTEFNTVFETVTALAEQVDPIKLNQTLTAAAEALTGLGDRFGRSLLDGNQILGDLNARMPDIRADTTLLADLAGVYAGASPDLFDGLGDAATSASTLDAQRADVDATLMKALGFADDAAGTFERAGPYLVRGAADLVPVSQLLDEYRANIFCSIRKFHEVQPRVAKTLGGNGYSLTGGGGLLAGGGNPYIYPDNLPRVNARGGPEGRPGCWQDISRDLFPAPYLVMDTGASIAPYNHLELGQPMFIDYVWGRQVGELTINP